MKYLEIFGKLSIYIFSTTGIYAPLPPGPFGFWHEERYNGKAKKCHNVIACCIVMMRITIAKCIRTFWQGQFFGSFNLAPLGCTPALLVAKNILRMEKTFALKTTCWFLSYQIIAFTIISLFVFSNFRKIAKIGLFVACASPRLCVCILVDVSLCVCVHVSECFCVCVCVSMCVRDGSRYQIG